MLRLQPVTLADKEALSYIEDLYVKSFPVDERRPFEKLVELLGNTPVFHLRLLWRESFTAFVRGVTNSGRSRSRVAI